MAVSVRLWDWPVRLTHWLLVLLFATSWVTAEQGWLEVHRASGLTMLAFILFRIYWGIFGSDTARFGTFVRGPAEVLRYVRGLALPSAGHNPLGGWSAVALLAALLSQTLLGLFAVDVDGIHSGPLAAYVNFETGRRAAHWHRSVFDILLWLVAVHTIAILAYFFVKRQNLILPMVTGFKHGPCASPAKLYFAPSWRAWIGMGLAGLLVVLLIIW